MGVISGDNAVFMSERAYEEIAGFVGTPFQNEDWEDYNPKWGRCSSYRSACCDIFGVSLPKKVDKYVMWQILKDFYLEFAYDVLSVEELCVVHQTFVRRLVDLGGVYDESLIKYVHGYDGF